MANVVRQDKDVKNVKDKKERHRKLKTTSRVLKQMEEFNEVLDSRPTITTTKTSTEFFYICTGQLKNNGNCAFHYSNKTWNI